MIISAPISVGELIDKITILEIKKSNVTDTEKLKNINNELTLLSSLNTFTDLKSEKELLFNINSKLWKIEDDIRVKEHKQEFDDEFIELARSVYVTNDERSKVKKDINIKTGSTVVEEKLYK